MNNKKKYYKLDDIGFVGTQEKSKVTKEEEKAISDFFKAEKMKNEKKYHLRATKKTPHTRLAKSA